MGRQIDAKNVLKFNLIQSDHSKDNWFPSEITSYLTEESVLKIHHGSSKSIKLQIQN